MLASYIAQSGEVDGVWMVLSPCNPLKDGTEMASEEDRLNMLRLACEDVDFLTVSDIELSLPRPSYTIDTLNALSEQNPEIDFELIVGGDNLNIFDRWRDSNTILDKYGLIVYPRPGYKIKEDIDGRIKVVDAPMVEISSTFIRQAISERKDVNFFVPPKVYQYIRNHKLYE
jgi:nicotinate-nucleotide adenylyltransferase